MIRKIVTLAGIGRALQEQRNESRPTMTRYPAGAAGNPSATETMFGMRQSWGDWGPLHGDAFIPAAGLADMLADGGDAACPVKA